MANDALLASLAGLSRGISRELEVRGERKARRRERRETQEFQATEAEKRREFEIEQLEKQLAREAERFEVQRATEEARTEQILAQTKLLQDELARITRNQTETFFEGVDPTTGESVQIPVTSESLQQINQARAAGIAQQGLGIPVTIRDRATGLERQVNIPPEEAVRHYRDAEAQHAAQLAEYNQTKLKNMEFFIQALTGGIGGADADQLILAEQNATRLAKEAFPDLFPPGTPERIPVPLGNGRTFNLDLVRDAAEEDARSELQNQIIEGGGIDGTGGRLAELRAITGQPLRGGIVEEEAARRRALLEEEALAERSQLAEHPITQAGLSRRRFREEARVR